MFVDWQKLVLIYWLKLSLGVSGFAAMMISSTVT